MILFYGKDRLLYCASTRGGVALSDEELRPCAPSIFASQPIDTVSDRYSFLPTSSILRGMRENGWAPVRAEQQSVRTEARRGFQKHLIRFARAEHLRSWEKNQVRPKVVLLNSHDKSSAYQLHCGLFRLVCSNGMVVALCWVGINEELIGVLPHFRLSVVIQLHIFEAQPERTLLRLRRQLLDNTIGHFRFSAASLMTSPPGCIIADSHHPKFGSTWPACKGLRLGCSVDKNGLTTVDDINDAQRLYRLRVPSLAVVIAAFGEFLQAADD